MENYKMLGTLETVVGGTEGGPGPTGVPPTTAAAAGAAGNGHKRPDPAVREKPVRRRFGRKKRGQVRMALSKSCQRATWSIDGPEIIINSGRQSWY